MATENVTAESPTTNGTASKDTASVMIALTSQAMAWLKNDIVAKTSGLTVNAKGKLASLATGKEVRGPISERFDSYVRQAFTDWGYQGDPLPVKAESTSGAKLVEAKQQGASSAMAEAIAMGLLTEEQAREIVAKLAAA